MVLTHLVLYSFLNGAGGVVEPQPTGQEDALLGGKGDNPVRHGRRRSFPPLGLDFRKRKEGEPQPGREVVDARVRDTQQLAAEVTADAARAFTDGAVIPVEIMSLAEVEREIGMLLRKQIRTEEDEVILLTLLAAVAVS